APQALGGGHALGRGKCATAFSQALAQFTTSCGGIHVARLLRNVTPADSRLAIRSPEAAVRLPGWE
ncbi:MAG TPA: hypothetical protein VL997_17190, partial [Dyella sp.]|nr:hypothetical protein [Dyella sp.]